MITIKGSDCFAVLNQGAIGGCVSNQIYWQMGEIERSTRAMKLGQQPKCIWLTGLSGAGKSTIASALEKSLSDAGRHVYVLDGDNVRHGLNRDLGFSALDRQENIRRVAEVAHLMVDAGLIVIVALISPFRSDRAAARTLFAPKEFIEVYVDASLRACEGRDTKGLYALARSGKLKEFTGIDSPYESPNMPEVHVFTEQQSLMDCIAEIEARIA